jgi:hypothetical protein
MISSHTGWDRNNPPPRGGNRHEQEISDLWRAYANCQALYDNKCKTDCPNDQQFKIPPAPKWLPYIILPIIIILIPVGI